MLNLHTICDHMEWFLHSSCLFPLDRWLFPKTWYMDSFYFKDLVLADCLCMFSLSSIYSVYRGSNQSHSLLVWARKTQPAASGSRGRRLCKFVSLCSMWNGYETMGQCNNKLTVTTGKSADKERKKRKIKLFIASHIQISSNVFSFPLTSQSMI